MLDFFDFEGRRHFVSETDSVRRKNPQCMTRTFRKVLPRLLHVRLFVILFLGTWRVLTPSSSSDGVVVVVAPLLKGLLYRLSVSTTSCVPLNTFTCLPPPASVVT